MVNMMGSVTQKNTAMTVGDWEKYRETKDKDKEPSVISFEFSHTKLENYTESPSVVRTEFNTVLGSINPVLLGNPERAIGKQCRH